LTGEELLKLPSSASLDILHMALNAMHQVQVPKPESIVACHGHAHSHAFSSGCISTSKQQLRYRQHLRLKRRGGRHLVLAAAATDVGTRAVQAIKKSVGGDVFVAGDSSTP